MTLQAIQPMHWPAPIIGGGALTIGLGAATLTFDSTADRLAWVGTSPITDSITDIYFLMATVTTGSTVDVRIESVSNGRPSGSLLAANTNVTVVIANGDDNVWKTATLTSAASLNMGDEFAIVIVNSSGTPNMQFVAGSSSWGFSSRNAHYPLCLQDTGGGTWASSGVGGTNGGFNWIVDYSSAGIVPMPCLWPVNGNGTITAYNSGTNPDERALRFQVPFKCRVVGARIGMFNGAAGSDFTVSLWPASSTTDSDVLASQVLDGDNTISTTTDGFVDVFFNTAVTLTINTTYYLGVRADTANNIGLGEFTHAGSGQPSGAIVANGVSTALYLSTRQWTAGSAGAWTDTTSTLPLINLIIDQLDDGASVGGGSGGQRVIGG